MKRGSAVIWMLSVVIVGSGAGKQSPFCDPLWLPIARPDDGASFVATTAGAEGLIVRAEILRGGHDGHPSGVDPGAAFLAPWAYSSDCTALPWSDGAWEPPATAAFYTGVLRPQAEWIQGTQTIDVLMAWREPLWQADDPRWGHRDGRLLSPGEFGVLYAALPTEWALSNRPDSVAFAMRQWAEAHRDIADRQPAVAIIANLLRSIQARQP